MILTIAALSTQGVDGSDLVDDFEWLVPLNAPPSTPSQYPEDVCVDDVTGETYVIWCDQRLEMYQNVQMTVFCSRFDKETMELETVSSHLYIGNVGSPRYNLVHDGRWFYFFQTDYDTLHMRVDEEGYDRLTLRFYHEPYNRWLMQSLLGVHEGRLMFMAADDSSETDGYDLYSMDIDTFVLRKTGAFDMLPNTDDNLFVMRDGMIYRVQARHKNDYEIMDVDLCTYDLDTRAVTGPAHLFTTHINRYGGFLFDVDSSNNIHLLSGSRNLTKYSISGEVLGTTLVPVPSEIEGARWREYELMVNRSDCVYFIGALRYNHSSSTRLLSCKIPCDYDGDVQYHNISSRFGVSSDICLGLDSGDRIVVAFYEDVGDLRRLAVSTQIDPSPDLSPLLSTFRMEEFPGSEDPVQLSVMILNMGRSTSTSHWVSIAKRYSGDSFFTEVDRVYVNVTIDPCGNFTFVHRTVLARAAYDLRISIEEVSPFENVRDNNAIVVMVHVRVNNPPGVMVFTPLDGSTFGDSIMISGHTEDIDGSEGVTTHLSGMPGVDIALPGTGEWNTTVDTGGVPSGDYNLTVQACDGSDLSAVIVRRVRVDHAEDSLLIGGISPEGDVTLVAGEACILQVNISDRFARPLSYRWTLGGSRIGSNTSFFRFSSDVPDLYCLEVTVSNGMTAMTVRWNVTVRAPTPPSINGFEPRVSPVLHKGEELEFRVSISNPDCIPCEGQWYQDGNLQHRGPEERITTVFSTSGSHSISMVLASLLGTEVQTWDVLVENRPPVVIDRGPPEGEIHLGGGGILDFSVNATDPDGDILSYTWYLVNASGSQAGRSSTTVEFAGGGRSVVIVDISDGEDTTRVEWTVNTTSGGNISWSWTDAFPWIALLVVVPVVVALVYNRWRTGRFPISRFRGDV